MLADGQQQSPFICRSRSGIHNPPVHSPPRLALAAPPNTPDLQPASIPCASAASLPPTELTRSPSEVPSEVHNDPEFLRKRKRDWAKLIAKTWGDDPSICRGCGKPMKIIAAIAPDQEDVIERILRHLRLWDPPWKRLRKARGPPRAPPAPQSTVDPMPDDESYCLDPPGAHDASE